MMTKGLTGVIIYIKDDGSALVAEVKDRTKEEILQEKTYRERCFVDYRIEEMQKEYEEARSYRRWDKKQECYVNHKGDPVVPSSQVVYNDVLAVIPLSCEYYSKIEKDKDYLKKLDKIIRDVMTASLRQRDEERMKKNVENLVDELKKAAEEVSDEQQNEEVKEEEAAGEEGQKPVEEGVTEKQQDDEGLKKKEESGEENQEKVDEKLEKLIDEAVTKEKKTTEEAEVPII
ncbi:hypothetical protein HanPI659440_Chr08g0309351 [Helianthus annuus]|nr:hypothetical protein HanPI659440_Chr08g0309351 [Helianthus annuus]